MGWLLFLQIIFKELAGGLAAKDGALSLLWLRSLVWCRVRPWPRILWCHGHGQTGKRFFRTQPSAFIRIVCGCFPAERAAPRSCGSGACGPGSDPCSVLCRNRLFRPGPAWEGPVFSPGRVSIGSLSRSSLGQRHGLGRSVEGAAVDADRVRFWAGSCLSREGTHWWPLGRRTGWWEHPLGPPVQCFLFGVRSEGFSEGFLPGQFN